MQSRNGSEFGIILFPRSGVDANADVLQCCSFISLNNYNWGDSTGSYVYVLFIHKKKEFRDYDRCSICFTFTESGCCRDGCRIDHHEFDFEAQKGFNEYYRKR